MVSDFAERVVLEARDWIGTPYRHQCSTKGAGADCLGVLLGIWRHLYGQVPTFIPAYTPDWSEAGQAEVLLTAAQAHLVPADKTAARGDVILFRMHNGSVAKHLGILTDVAPQIQFVHAYSGHGVVESPLSQPWQRRTVARFRFPERT